MHFSSEEYLADISIVPDFIYEHDLMRIKRYESQDAPVPDGAQRYRGYDERVHLSGAGGCGCGDVQDGEGRIASEKAGPDFRWRKEYGEAERENVQSNLNEVGAHR